MLQPLTPGPAVRVCEKGGEGTTDKFNVAFERNERILWRNRHTVCAHLHLLLLKNGRPPTVGPVSVVRFGVHFIRFEPLPPPSNNKHTHTHPILQPCSPKRLRTRFEFIKKVLLCCIGCSILSHSPYTAIPLTREQPGGGCASRLVAEIYLDHVDRVVPRHLSCCLMFCYFLSCLLNERSYER